MSAVSQFRPDDETSGLLRAIVESSDDAIIGKALDGTIVSWNAGAQRMYGLHTRRKRSASPSH
jgi:PAS domain S-box-containing protein